MNHPDAAIEIRINTAVFERDLKAAQERIAEMVERGMIDEKGNMLKKMAKLPPSPPKRKRKRT